jgi:hypothetical protein
LGNKYSQDLNRKLCSEKRTPNDPNLHFKENYKEGGEGRSQLNGQRKVPMLGGPWKEKEKPFFTSSHFSLDKFDLNFHFFH